jgi:hypothetical protein
MEKISNVIIPSFMTVIESRTSDPKEVAHQIRDALKSNKVVKLKLGYHVSDLRSFYNKITDELGTPHNIAEDFKQGGIQTGERWMEIRYDTDIPDLSAYRHSQNGQPLHTDESYISNPCDIMVFYCVNKAISGGQTIFVDGLKLVERMKSIAPELLDKLSTTNVCYEKAGNKRTEKIIDLSIPNQPAFNFNYYCISPNESLEAKSLNTEFYNFLETHVKGSYIENAVQLLPGESVYWWDHFVLHGRNPFDAEKTNDRFIWKTGVSWNDNK